MRTGNVWVVTVGVLLVIALGLNGFAHAAQSNDLFSEGAVWTGSRFYNHKGADKTKAQEWKLRIQVRKGSKFEGQIEFISIDGKQQTLAVEGTAPRSDKGKVEFKTSHKGVLQQSFKGALSEGRISVTFSGTGVGGDPVSGTGYLTQ